MCGSAPTPTPPQETSAAQTGSNVATATANAYLGNVNEYTPDGSKVYEQTGSQTITDPFTGQTYNIPQFSVTQSLSENQQAIKTQNDAASLNLATLGNSLSGSLSDQLTGNFELSNEAAESRLFDLGSKRLDPMFERRESDLRDRLANQGIRAGSEAYDREMSNFSNSQNDAYNQLALTGRAQANQELLTQDNQRINQISALLSGGQVSQPNFMGGINTSQLQGTDNAAIIANSDNQAANSWAQSQAAIGSTLGGIGGLFALSDERAKHDKEKIGETKDGMGIYSFKYKGSEKTEIGLMAQEVRKKKPEAVATRPDGLFAVDYGKALA